MPEGTIKIWPHPAKKDYARMDRHPAAATYVELQSYSNFSFLRGASHPEELVEQAANVGYSAIALTDRHSFAGIVRAHIAAKKLGIQFIVGTTIPLYREIPERKSEAKTPEEYLEVKPQDFKQFTIPISLLLYPTSKDAYGRLCTLLTKGKLRAPKGNCFLQLEDLPEASQGLLAIAVIHNLHYPNLMQRLEKLKQIFDCDRLSLALTQAYGPDSKRRTRLTERLSSLLKIPLVATNDVHYHMPERRMLQDVVTCIRKGQSLKEAGLQLFQNAERYLKPPEEMFRLFAKFPQALERSRDIARLAANFSLDQLHYEYPHEVCVKDLSPIDYLRKLTFEGVKERYPKGLPKKVLDQVEHELALIEELNYPKYFLTVHDIVRFARSQGILCQGRGAAANSAVCYLLGITAVDPDRINLLFERFISKERNEPPDIDIDFEHERREEVIQYIYQKYGRDRAALTAAVITYRTRSTVRDVGKVFGLPLDTVENIIRLLTRVDSSDVSEESFKHYDLDPEDHDIILTINLSRELRGFPRHLSQHVGGFIICEKPLKEIVPIENASMPDRTVIEWDKDDIDSMGMLKIDILALGMLTCIRKAFTLINERLPEENKLAGEILKLHNIPPEDPAVYDMLSRADSLGIFQIESRAQMSMLPRLRPRCFYDLVIEVAIVRPGPIQGGMVHPYLRRRNGLERETYPNLKIKKILAPTLGVPIFQEQVMELSVVAAGFTPGEADELRRAMASWKKSSKLIPRFGEKLITGMRKNGYSLEFAHALFEQIKGFGEYGFPQSHAASFALLVYVSAWLKKHHPAAFAAALLNSQPMGFYRPAQIIQDAKNHGAEVLPVDVNFSNLECTIEGSDNRLRLGMRLAKGLEWEEAERLVACVKEEGRFNSVTTLWKKSGVSASTLKKLALADAFASMKLTRQQALWEIKKLRDEKLPLFEGLEASEPQAKLPAVTKQAEVLKDYESLSLSLKAHPLSFLRQKLNQRGVCTAYQLKEDPTYANGSQMAISGLVLIRQRPMTASGVVFMTVEDETGMANLIIKPRIFKQYRDVICDSAIILAKGHVQRESGVVHLIAEDFKDLTSVFTQLTSLSRDFH